MKKTMRILARMTSNIFAKVIKGVTNVMNFLTKYLAIPLGSYMLLGIIGGTIALAVSPIFGKEATVAVFNDVVAPALFLLCWAGYFGFVLVKEFNAAAKEIKAEDKN